MEQIILALADVILNIGGKGRFKDLDEVDPEIRAVLEGWADRAVLRDQSAAHLLNRTCVGLWMNGNTAEDLLWNDAYARQAEASKIV